MAHLRATYYDQNHSIAVEEWSDGSVSAQARKDDTTLRDICSRINDYGSYGNTIEDAILILDEEGYQLKYRYTNEPYTEAQP